MAGKQDADVLPRRRLGRTRLSLTEVGLGTAALGNLYAPIDPRVAQATVEAAWNAGMRFFDTAPFYGFGLSERRLGDVLREHLGEPFAVSTKVGRLLRPMPDHSGAPARNLFHTPMPFSAVFDYSYDGIMRSYEQSLQRLGLARIDVLLIHDIGVVTHGAGNASMLETLRSSGYRALEQLRASGDVQAIGIGANEWQACDEAMDWGRFDCFLLAGRYTLLEQEPLQRFLPRCAEHGATVIVGGAYNSGILAADSRGAGPRYYDYQPAAAPIVERVSAIEHVCAAHGVALAAAALQFPLAHPQVTTVIPGAATAEEVGASIDRYHADIPAAFWSDLKSAGLIALDAPVPGPSQAVA